MRKGFKLARKSNGTGSKLLFPDILSHLVQVTELKSAIRILIEFGYVKHLPSKRIFDYFVLICHKNLVRFSIHDTFLLSNRFVTTCVINRLFIHRRHSRIKKKIIEYLTLANQTDVETRCR